MNQIIIKKLTIRFLILLMGCVLFCCGCGFKNNVAIPPLPDGFNNRSDTAKFSFLKNYITPDSMARLLCDAAIGKIPEIEIDSFSSTVRYAYMAYSDSALISFCEELNNYPRRLPPGEKIKIYILSGEGKPGRLGYRMGLDYAENMGDDSLSLRLIDEEIAIVREQMADRPVDFEKFMAGLKAGRYGAKKNN